MFKLLVFVLIFCFFPIRYSSAQEEKNLSSAELIQKLQAAKKKKAIINISIQLADAYRMDGAPDKAISLCKDTLGLEPDKRQQQKLYRILGDSYSSKKEYSNAIINYQEAASLAPEHEGVLLSLAKTYELSDLYELAINEYSKILEFDRKSFDANYALGNLYLKQGFTDKAVRCFRLAVLAKVDANAYQNLALCYESLGDTDLAISMMKSAVAIAGKYSDYVSLGRFYAANKKNKEAEETFLKAEAIDKNSLDAYLYLGMLYINNNDIDKAKNIFISCAKTFPESAIVHFFLGEIYYKENKKMMAKNEMKQCSELAKSDALKTYSIKYLDFMNNYLK